MKTNHHRNVLSRALCFLALTALVAGCDRSGTKTAGAPENQSTNQPAEMPVPNAATDNKAVIEAIHPIGEPTTPAELNAWYAEPPAGQNAAPLYAEAFTALIFPASGLPPPPASNGRALTLLHQAAARTQCRYPINLNEGFHTKLPHLANIKHSAELLQQAAILNATQGRTDRATESINVGLSLARSLEQEPTGISQLVRARVIEITVNGLEQALSRKAFSDEQLSRLQSDLQVMEQNDAAAFVRGLIGERIMGLAAFQLPPQSLAMLIGSAGDPESATASSDADVTAILERHAKSAEFDADRAFYVKQMDELMAVTKTPASPSLETAEKWSGRVREAKTKGHLISRCLLPAPGSVPEKSAIDTAELRAAQTVLAVERHRLAHQSTLPSSLKDLVPQYLKAVPTDPFDGSPLRFKKLSPRGYMIYSIGKDRHDDGGIHKPLKPTVGAKYDLAVTVTR